METVSRMVAQMIEIVRTLNSVIVKIDNAKIDVQLSFVFLIIDVLMDSV